MAAWLKSQFSNLSNIFLRWRSTFRDDPPAVPVALLSSHYATWGVDILSGEQLVRHAKTLAAVHTVRLWKSRELLLGILDHDYHTIRASIRTISQAFDDGMRLTPAAEWLLDNNYLIEEQVSLTRRHLPRGYSRELPHLAKGSRIGQPRVFDIAAELIIHTDGRFDSEELGRFLRAYQSVAVLSLGELWAIPIMLRLAVIGNIRRIADRVVAAHRDRELADRWAGRFLQTASTTPKRIVIDLADLVNSGPPLTRPFVVQLANRLQGQLPALGMILDWLEHELADHGQSLHNILQIESHSVSANQASISNSITTLRSLSSVDWPVFVESQSVVESCLRLDPPNVYLMPMLVMPNYEGTLLDQTCRSAVNEQISYGDARGVPWGISESGYNLVDAQLNYQYRAFGVPSLGMKRGLADDLVIAPYAPRPACLPPWIPSRRRRLCHATE